MDMVEIMTGIAVALTFVIVCAWLASELDR